MTGYSPAQGYQFNATVTDNVAVDDVWIEHNFTGTLTNYTVSTKAGDEYYYDYGTLGAGFYYIKWYANCTAGVLNSSDWAHYYQIGKADPTMTLTGSGTTITYGTSLTVTGDAITICPQEFANVSNSCGGLGTGSYETTGSWISEPYGYGNWQWALSDGNWSSRAYAENDASFYVNYSIPSFALSATWFLKDTGGVHEMAIPSDCFGQGVVRIHVRGVYNSVGIFCLNHSSNTETGIYYRSGDNYFYEENMTWFYAPLNSLYKNGTLVANPYSAVLAAGGYNFTWNSTGNDNYTANSTSVLVTVEKAHLPITLYIDGTDGDMSVINISIANFTANFSAGYSFPITLYTNLTGAMGLWDTQNSPFVNYTGLSPCRARAYQAIANWTGNENYTYSQANHSLNLRETVILAQFAYPADATANTTARTIGFAWNATYYGGTAANCSLWDNHTGSWMFTQANTSVIVNNSINVLNYSYLIDYKNISWAIQCYDTTNKMNFTQGNRTLEISLNRNITAITIVLSTSVYQNSENQARANVSDLVTNLSVAFGTMSVNLTKADGISIKENMTYDSNESLWLSGNHTFDVLGLWTLVFDYYGEDLFGNSTNSSNVTVNAVPAAVSSGGGSGGSNCYYNWTCSDWTPANCPESGKQTRQCVNSGTCRGTVGKPLESQNCSYASPIPKQLLDVVLSLESNALSNSSDLVATVSFTSFGKEPADISTTYRVFDEKGQVLYTSHGQVIVYTNKLETVYFKDLELPAGDYDLELEIDYFNVTDRFEQEFKVIGSSLVPASAEALNIPGMILIIVAALGIAGVIYMLRPPIDREDPPRAQPISPPMDTDATYPFPPVR